jgi:hypothetical protein
MTFPHFNRRLHIYLGLFLLPWFFAYGVTSVPFSHPRQGGRADWTLRFERPYQLPLPASGDLKEIGAALVREAGVEGAHGAYRPSPNLIEVYVYTFWDATRISYDSERKVLRAQDRRFRWDYFLTGLHARGGFLQDSVLDDAWAVVVDVVSAGFLLWIASGLYMWWHLPRHRGWGWLALAAGAAAFTAFLLVL